MLEIVIFSLIVLIFGILPGIWYFKRDKSLDKNKNKKTNLFFVVLSIPLIIINSYVAFLVGKGSIEYIVVYVFFVPIVIILRNYSPTQKPKLNLLKKQQNTLKFIPLCNLS